MKTDNDKTENPELENSLADTNFHENKEEAKKDFNKAADLYRNYVGKATTPEERMRRIREFRCG